MDTIGLDRHKRESQFCTLTPDGELLERRIATRRERFTAVLGGRPRAPTTVSLGSRAVATDGASAAAGSGALARASGPTGSASANNR